MLNFALLASLFPNPAVSIRVQSSQSVRIDSHSSAKISDLSRLFSQLPSVFLPSSFVAPPEQRLLGICCSYRNVSNVVDWRANESIEARKASETHVIPDAFHAKVILKVEIC